LALEQAWPHPQFGFNSEVLDYAPSPRRYFVYGQQQSEAFLVQAQLSDSERASIAEDLAIAAERLADLGAAQNYLRTAIVLASSDKRDSLQHKLDVISAEQDRRAKNATRQPAVKNVIEQNQIVRARIVQ
jgi:hypothetical protein